MKRFYFGIALMLIVCIMTGIYAFMPRMNVRASDDIISIQTTTQPVITTTSQTYGTGKTTVAPTSWGYRYELANGDIVEVGDSATSDFRAHVKTIRNDGTCWFSLGLTGGTFVPTLTGEKIAFPFNSNINVEIYPVPPSTRLPEGGIEYNLTLLSRPAGNPDVTFNIDWQGITWQKLLALDVEYPTDSSCVSAFGAQGSPYVRAATSIVGADGETYKTRAEYEVNSYLGTATSNRQTHDQNWGTNKPSFTSVSRTHLYIHRGQMTDALGAKTWVEDINLDQTAKTITFTLPRTWLRNAAYPVSQVCGVDPAYTQQMELVEGLPPLESWNDIDIFTANGVPKGAVAELIGFNSDASGETTLGVRTDGSGLARLVTLHEAEAGGLTHCRFFVTCHATTGLVEINTSAAGEEFQLAGYWTNVTFTELATAIAANASGSFTDETLAVGASAVHHIIMANNEADVANTMGVRANGSALTRSVLVHEPEAGGSSYLDMLVKSDASKIIELYSSDATNATFIDSGYFGTELDFVELFQQIANDGDGDWDGVDLTAYLDADGRMVDFLLTHAVVGTEQTLGVRGGDDGATLRYLLEHEAEDNGGATGEVTGFSMSAQSNASGVVNLYSDTTTEFFYLTGYFKPASTFDISNTPLSKAFSIVANSTTYWAIGHTPDNPIDDAHCTFTLTNNGATAIDIDAKVADFTGGVGWNIGTPAENQARITWFKSGDDPAAGTVLTNSDQEVYDGLAASGHFHWEFKLETPTSVTDGVAKSATLTLTAVAED